MSTPHSRPAHRPQVRDADLVDLTDYELNVTYTRASIGASRGDYEGYNLWVRCSREREIRGIR